MQKNLFLPGNLRYQPASLQPIWGYDNLYQPAIQVEFAAMETLGDIGIIPAADIKMLTPELKAEILENIWTTDVDMYERNVTKHDIRALVHRIQECLPIELRRWVHIPLTSYDPLETSRIIQYVQAYHQVVRPTVNQVIVCLASLVKKHAGILQVGRTHGQHALPVTVGFWLASVLSRIVFNVKEMERHSTNLVGKIAGAVGASNAVVALGIRERCGLVPFEARVLEKLGLKPAKISTQILAPEPLAYFLYSCTMLSASLGQFGRDCRQLMRSEIAEIGEPFEKQQVGSSTMAQKRNPITFEQIEGMWWRTKNEFGKVFDSLISEHQRDLVGSSLARDFPIIVINLVHQLKTLMRPDKRGTSFLSRLTVNEDRCKENLSQSANVILAEPLYIALQMAGYQGDAHELVNRKAVPMSQRTGQKLFECLAELAGEDTEVAVAFAAIPPELQTLLQNPEQYTGDAAEKALAVGEEAFSFVVG